MSIVRAVCLALSILSSVQAVAFAETPAWQPIIKAELAHAQKMGFVGAYDVSGGSIWVPVPWDMAKAFDAAPYSDIIVFLERLASNQSDQRQRHYLQVCVLALKANDRSLPSMITHIDGTGEWVVYFRIPMSQGFRWKTQKRPNQSSEPTPTSVTTPAAQEIAPAAVVAHL